MILASGRGSNFESISDHIELGILQNVRVGCLICNRPGALVVELARSRGVRVTEIGGIFGKKYSSSDERENARRQFEENCLSAVANDWIDLVVLAGFDQLLSREFVEHFPHRILNIHPAYDLVKYGGKNMVGQRIHKLVIENKEEYSGCTVHVVIPEVDQGPAVLKKRVKVLSCDTPETLEKRILLREHLIYPEAIQLYADSRVKFDPSGACIVDFTSGSWEPEWNKRQSKYIQIHSEEMSEIFNES